MGAIRRVSAGLGSRANDKKMHHIGAGAPKTCNSRPCACLPQHDLGGMDLLSSPTSCLGTIKKSAPGPTRSTP
ncbi:hypothetical protein D3C84_938940 [compost metagenome]